LCEEILAFYEGLLELIFGKTYLLFNVCVRHCGHFARV
jgi:hypothetical protein